MGAPPWRVDVAGDQASAAFERLAARVCGFHPALRDVRLERRSAGPIAIPRDRVPIAGALAGSPRVIVTGGYAGHGVALAVRVGELVATSIAGGGALPDRGRP